MLMDVKVSSKIMEKERQKPCNKYCADCNTISPQWISIKFGVFICLRCSGIHRSLGTHLTFVRSATLDALKSDVVEQYQNLNNEIMNEYYESNMPGHSKPQQSTDTRTVERFIKDKYVKKIWINDDDEDPVELYKSGELQKSQKKKEKKAKKKSKKEKTKKKKEKVKETESTNESNLIDFQEGDDFGDFQEANGIHDNAKSEDIGDLIGGDDDFGDFAAPEVRKHDDDFGEFAHPTSSTGIDMNMFSTAPSVPPSEASKNSNNLINNLSNLYSQNQTIIDPTSKYAALESMSNQIYPQQYQQKNSDMFFGMAVNNGGFPSQPQNAFSGSGFPTLTHQHSYPPSDSHNIWSQSTPVSSFPAQNNYNFNAAPSHGIAPTHSFSYSSSTTSMNAKKDNNGSNDMFGLKATLEQKNKMYKYNNGMDGNKQPQAPSAFSGLVSTQWNA